MKGLKHVISFEYLNVVRRKAYVISIAFYILVVTGISFVPAIIEFFSNDETQVNMGTAVFFNDTSHAMPPLDVHIPQHDWNEVASFEQLQDAVATGEAAFGLHFISPSSYRIVTTDYNFVPHFQLLQLYIDDGLTIEFYMTELIQLDGDYAGVDPSLLVGPAGDVVGNIALVIVFFAVISSGSAIMASITKEKTSKIVELLFTSASPTSIMLGKVIASALVLLTTSVILFASVFIINQFSGSLGDVVSSDGLLYGYPTVNFLYMVLFFITAFVSLAFIYAGLAATVGDNQESSALAVIPMFITMGSFYLGLGMLGSPNFISEAFVNVISYVPFVSPFAMIARLNTMIIPTAEILLILGLNVVYSIAAAIISARVYTMCIMLFGTKINFRFLFKRLRKG